MTDLMKTDKRECKDGRFRVTIQLNKKLIELIDLKLKKEYPQLKNQSELIREALAKYLLFENGVIKIEE